HRISQRIHDDRYGASRAFCRFPRRRGGYDNYIGLPPHTLGGEIGKTFAMPFGGKIVDGERLPVDISQVMQRFEERFEPGRFQRAGVECQKTKTGQLLNLLRTPSKGPSHRYAADKRDELTPPHCCPRSPPEASSKHRSDCSSAPEGGSRRFFRRCRVN